MVLRFLITSILGTLALTSGCMHQYEVDFQQLKDFPQFQWNGKVTVVTTEAASLFESARILRVEMHGQNGRTFLIEPRGAMVKAYVEVPTREVTVRPASTAPSEEVPVKEQGPQ